MIVQILRAALIAIGIYLITTLARNFIDRKLGKSRPSDEDEVSGENENDVPKQALTLCSACGVYYESNSTHECSGQ